MKVNRGILILTVGLLLDGVLAVGQQGAPGFAVDDPELYFGVFSLHQKHQEQIAAAKAAEAGRAKDVESEDPTSASLHQAFAQQFGVTEADYDRVSGVAASVLDRIFMVNQAVMKLRDDILTGRAAGRARPDAQDRAKALAFQQERTDILRDGMKELQAALSPQGWNAFHSFINGTYRSHIVRKELPHGQ